MDYEKLEIIAFPQPMPDDHSEAWHDERRRCIGGSDAAAVLGMSNWRTPYDVWHDKVFGAEFKGNEATRRGQRREPQIVSEYATLTGRVVYQPGHLTIPDQEYVGCNLDGLCRDRAIEAKTANANAGMYWGDPGTITTDNCDGRVPLEYFLQCQHNMLVAVATGCLDKHKPLCDLFVSIGGEAIQIYTVVGDPELWDAMLETYKEFWRRVEEHDPPELQGIEDVERCYPVAAPSSCLPTKSVADSLAELARIKRAEDELEARKKACQLAVKAHMGECEQIIDESGKALVTWNNAAGKARFDTTAFRHDHPELYERYLTVGKPTRIFIPKYERIEAQLCQQN